MMILKTLTLTFPLGPQKILAVLWRQWKPNGNSGQISYMHALTDLTDFCKFQGVSGIKCSSKFCCCGNVYQKS